MEDKLVQPSKSAGDTAHLVAKAALSAIPYVGGPAAELFAALIQPPLERRREEWMRTIGEVLSDLQTRGVKIDELGGNETFIDTVLQATHIALRHHQATKREALKNAVRNTAIGRAPEDLLRQMFLRCVDEFTEEHLAMLALFDDPPDWFKRAGKPFPNLSMGGLSSVLEHAYPALGANRPVYDQLWTDLRQRGLVTTDGLHTTMTGQGLQASRTSELGKQFLRFIQAV